MENTSNSKQDEDTEVYLIDEVEEEKNHPHVTDNQDLFIDLSEVNKSIHLNAHLHGLKKSATLDINEKSRELEKKGKKIYKFGLGQSPFPVPDVVVESLKKNAFQKDYLPVYGLWELREAVAKFHTKKNGINFLPDQVMIGPGSKELLFLVQLTFNGDLIVPSPCWVSYIPQAKIIGRKVRLLHTDYSSKWRVTARNLRNLCEEDKINQSNRPRILLLNYPGNPEGNTYSDKELQELAKVARNHNILILSDEIYAELNFEGNHISIARYYPEGTIISSGLSKWCGAGGWRLGTFTFPRKLKWLQESMAVVASETYTSVSAPIQYAAITAFNGDPTIENYLFKTRKILQALGNWCANELKSTDILVHNPIGAFYLFLDFDNYQIQFEKYEINNSRDLVNRLLEETGVALLPGVEFARPLEEYTARLAYVNFDGEKALNAMENNEIDEQFLQKYCQDTLEGIRLICAWTKKFSNKIDH